MSPGPFDIEREPGSQDLRARLIEELRTAGAIRTIGVAAAFGEVPRELFIPEVAAERGLEAVYRDEAYITKTDPQGMPLSSSSQPAMMALMLELLAVAPGHRVLEIGAGTGYNAALLSRLVGPLGEVTTIDVDPSIAGRAEHALREAGDAVDVVVGDGRQGHPASAPYDRIIVTASAEEITAAWFAQLAEGGRLVVPLRLDSDADAIQLIPAFVREGEALRAVESTSGGFMRLHGGDGASRAPAAAVGATLSAGGRHTVLVQLSGSALERLPETAAKRILSAVLHAPPRKLAEGTTRLIGGPTPEVLIYLMVRIPDSRRIWIRHSGRHGVGLLDPRGPSVAAVTLRSLWELGSAKSRRARWRLESWGERRAAGELERLVADWQALQRERKDCLEITAAPAGGAMRLSFRWVDRR